MTPPTPPRLLLVEDNPDNLELLAVLLSERYPVASYGSAAEALNALDAVEPDLLVLDIGMTPVDGLQCLQAIRARPRYARTPAIALTAFAREVEREAFLAAGFQAVVTKPILDPRELVAVVDRVLNEPPNRGLTRAPRDPIILGCGHGSAPGSGPHRAPSEDPR
jgi:CheY-like chemotaxis protein